MRISKDGGKACWFSVFVVLVSAFLASAQPPQRALLSGQIPEAVHALKPLGRLDGSAQLNLSIDLPLHDRAALTNLIEQLYDPASPLYHHYLTPDEFDGRFGPTEEEYQAVIAWATRSGFTITARHPDRTILQVSASVAEIERALLVTIRTYSHPSEARTFFAPDSEPSLEVAGVPILSIEGLDNYARPHPKNLRRAPLRTAAKATAHNIGSGPNGNLAGFDYRAAYVPGVSLTGAGQSVGLLEFDAYYPGDITTYESLTGVTNVPLQIVPVNGGVSTPGSQNGEVALDIEMAISMAPGLSSVVVFEGGPAATGNTMLAAMSSSTYTNVKQFSCSWSFGPITAGMRTTMDNYFMKFAADGQSFFNASGDTGATNNFVGSPPDDDPYITLVGGTVLGTAGPGSTWLSETAWNAQEGPGYNSSTGGVSTTYAIPSWQKGVSMTANNGSTSKRNCPDVAMAADNVFIVADNGQEETTGGTSCASPLWAGFAALVNQQAAAASLPPIGFLNPALYHIGTNSAYNACFDDVTVGNNTNTTSAVHWLAVRGYDLCTGWGSPSGGSLIIALTQPDGFQITAARAAVANGPAGGPFTTTTQTFSLTNTGAAALNWSLGTTSTWLNLSSTSGTLTASGGGTSISLNLNSAALSLAAGVYTADLWFTNLTSGLAQLRQYTLQVGQELVLDGGFEAGDFCYWVLSGDSSIYTNNFVDFSLDPNGVDYASDAGIYFGALGQVNNLAYLSQPLPTRAGQLYLLSLWFENNTGYTPNQFQVQWNTNSSAANVIYDQTDMGAFDWSNLQFTVSASSNVTILQIGARNDNDFDGVDNVSVMAVPMPNFQAPTVANGILQLAWPALPGVSYQVQYATSLSPPNWTPLAPPVTATTSPLTASDNIGPAPQRFYRVTISP